VCPNQSKSTRCKAYAEPSLCPAQVVPGSARHLCCPHQVMASLAYSQFSPYPDQPVPNTAYIYFSLSPYHRGMPNQVDAKTSQCPAQVISTQPNPSQAQHPCQPRFQPQRLHHRTKCMPICSTCPAQLKPINVHPSPAQPSPYLAQTSQIMLSLCPSHAWADHTQRMLKLGPAQPGTDHAQPMLYAAYHKPSPCPQMHSPAHA
jgi:hypothetical protein